MDRGEEWTQALPQARLVTVPEASHFAYVERGDRVWREIEAFLENTAP